MEKTQLFYFSKNDLMISVVYDKLENMASYKCHRPMAAKETALIEKYIEVKILETSRSIITYIGEDEELQKTWDEFHSTKRDSNWTAKKLDSSEQPGVQLKDKYKKEITDELKKKDDLIKKIHDNFSDKKELLANLQSFLLEGISTKNIEKLKKNADEGFCFDTIGDILRDRTENHPEEPMYRMRELVVYLKEYNKLTNNNITIDSLIT